MEKELYEFIGSKIKAYRGKMSQEELARKLNVSANTVSRWETGTYKPTVEDLDRLARVFNIPIWALLPTTVQPPTEKLRALLSSTGDLLEDDLEELQRYADFIRARKTLKQASRSRKAKA